MTAEQLKNVVESHKNNIKISDRTALTEMCWLVEDLLQEELRYLKETEPAAFNTIADTEKAIEIVRDLYHSIDDMDTDEIVEAGVWD